MRHITSVMIVAAVILMAFMVPVSAVWQNGNWVQDGQSTAGQTVTYNSVTDVTSKYNANVGSKYDLAHQQTGFLRGTIKCANGFYSTYMNVTNDKAPNAEPLRVKINADGSYDAELVAGHYQIVIPNGVGGVPEYSSVLINPGYISAPEKELIGHIVSRNGPYDQSYINIVSAIYGGETVSHVVHHEAVQGTSAYYTVEKADWHWVGWHRVYEGDCEKVYFGHGDFKIGNQKYRFTNHGEYQSTYHEAVAGVPAWDETVIDYLGGSVDVTSNVREVVDAGYNSFLFDNRPCEGGIFTADGTTLLSEIKDPAVGIVKDVTIVYNNGGADITVNAKEYEVITLNH